MAKYKAVIVRPSKFYVVNSLTRLNHTTSGYRQFKAVKLNKRIKKA